MSEGLYERSMLITGAVSLFVNIAGPIANKYGAKCFAAGTVIHTKTGLKAIEEIEVGDEVLSYDEETGTQGYKPVVRLYRNVTEEWYVIRVNGEELKCTAEHPFYVVGKGFVPARGIHSSDKVLQSDGRYGIIEAVEVERLSEPETTYNFEVAEYHTYYVGSGILTHNKCVAKEGDYMAVVNEINETEAPHAHILKNRQRVAKVNSIGSIIKGSQTVGVRRFVNKYMDDIIIGINKYYPQI